MKLLSSTIALSLLAAPLSLAQNDNDSSKDQVNQAHFWEANLPGGKYLVSLSRISSISLHKYHMQGMVIHEVDVETMGAALARFYVIELVGESDGPNGIAAITNRAREIADQAGGKTGVDTSTAVHKEYPITTHARTIEYKLGDLQDLEALYDSLSKAWKNGRGRKFTIK
ncbi:hypothetical protein [Rubritalea marina]|uniref:hypothetical protein n=1 Tax=Rubritalea marina TaxID=361055 RepID=UPI000378BC5D|nr:hypothetical protein [Rubritalea marina]